MLFLAMSLCLSEWLLMLSGIAHQLVPPGSSWVLMCCSVQQVYLKFVAHAANMLLYRRQLLLKGLGGQKSLAEIAWPATCIPHVIRVEFCSQTSVTSAV
jgi:hypothetical protein